MFTFARALGLCPLVALGAFSACSPGSKTGEDSKPVMSGGSSSTGGAGGSTGGTVPIGTGGNGASGGGVAVSGGASGSGGDLSGTGGTMLMECAGDVETGMPVPVDVYVMLDTSASMEDVSQASGTGASKWDAVKGALSSFFADPQSAGLSVALQFFPQYLPNVPATCTTDADCGAGAPCLTDVCAQTPNQTLVQCTPGATATDPAPCTSPIIFDDGPCDAGFCHLSGKACTALGDCQTTGAALGSCLELGECEGNHDLSCAGVGQNKAGCGADGGPGMCVAAPTSHFCLHEKVCDPAGYQTPSVEFLTLPDTATALTTALTARMPAGDTPTRPALRGAIAHAREWAASHVGHSVLVLLATDGLPTACSGGRGETGETTAALDDAVTAAQEGFTGASSIQTLVIGVFADAEATAKANLDRIAKAGGSDQAFVLSADGNVQQTFLDTLNSIRAARLACEFQVPQPKSGSTLDIHQVNVELTADGASSELFYVKPGGCTGAADEWQYDKEPIPTKLVACPKTCDMLKKTANAQVSVKLGCMQHIR